MFLLNRGELDERLDIEYYQPKHFELLAKLLASCYPLKLLKDISKRIVDGPFGSSVKADDYVEKGIPFLRVADITHGNGTIELDGLIYISSEKHKEISRSTVFPNDVVIAKTGATMGAASVVPETIPEANIRGDLAAVIVNDVLLSNYIVNFINTPIGQDLFWRLNSGATRGRVVISNLRKYPLIMPDVEKMAEINQFVSAAKARKKQKEAEAAALLASIDGYLLQELGITLPPSSAPKKIFYARASKVSGGRFDALSHQTDVFYNFKAGKYDLVAVKEITSYLKTGFAAGKQDQDLEEIGVIQIRPTNVKEPERSLTFDRNVYIKLSEIETRKLDLLQKNEVLFNNTNSQELVGKTTLFNLEGDYFCSNHMTRIGVSEKIDSVYLTHILNLYQHLRVFYRMCVNWNNQSGVNTEMLRGIKIPLPPSEKQTEIGLFPISWGSYYI